MPRVLTIDLLEFLGLLSLGAVAYFFGRNSHTWPKALRNLVIVVALVLIVYVACVYSGLLPLQSRLPLLYLRGPKFVLALVALFLLGMAWHEPKRSFSPFFLLFLVSIAGLMLLIEAGGPLYWRTLDRDSWSRTPDAHGCMKQSTMWSCGPAATVMLLHRYGIAASEGEMAYLSRTSFFGTDGWALAVAVAEKAQSRGWTANFEITDYDRCLTRRQPFIATIRSAGMFAHAIYVEQIGPEAVTIIDPGNGIRKLIGRAQFEEKWNGEAIHILLP